MIWIGIIIGIILTVSVEYMVFKMDSHIMKTIVGILKKANLKAAIAVVSIGIVLICIYNGSEGNMTSEMLNTILSFFGSFIFAWILTEYTTQKEYKEHQKSISIRSFRHTLKLNKQIEETIGCIETVLKDYRVCAGANTEINQHRCGLSNQLTLITNMLTLIKKQVSANLDDWSDEFARELENVKEVIRYKQQAMLTDPEILVNENGDIDPEACERLIQLNNVYIQLRNELQEKVPDYMYNFLNEEEFMSPFQNQTDSITSMENNLNRDIQQPKIKQRIRTVFSSSAVNMTE